MAVEIILIIILSLYAIYSYFRIERYKNTLNKIEELMNKLKDEMYEDNRKKQLKKNLRLKSKI